jgi:proteasome lid subunit RPN8/RPN11
MNLLKEIKAYSKRSPTREVCGLVRIKNGHLYFQPSKNYSPVDNIFEINPMEYLDALLAGDLVASFHSHIDCSEEFSQYDKDSADNAECPSLVYSLITDKFNLYYKDGFSDLHKRGIKRLTKEIGHD